MLRTAPSYRLLGSGADARIGTIYAFDAANNRLVALSKVNGAFLGQFRLGDGSDEWSDMRDFYVEAGVEGEPDAIVWIGKDAVHRSVLASLDEPGQLPGSIRRIGFGSAERGAARRGMIPLRDRNPTRRTPFITWGLIGACFAAFAIELSVTATGGDRALDSFFQQWGAVPADITRALEAGTYLGQATLGMFTSMFLHGGWLHLLGNMLFLWIFGNNVEDRVGPIPFLLFYLVGGIAAALTQVVIDPSSNVPLVGASGAIAAALGAYIVLFPGARILSLVFLGFFYQLLEVPAILVLGIWFALQLRERLCGVRRLDRAGRRRVLRAHRRVRLRACRRAVAARRRRRDGTGASGSGVDGIIRS